MKGEPTVHTHLTNGHTSYVFPTMLYSRKRICSCYLEKKEERQRSQRAPEGRVEHQMFVCSLKPEAALNKDSSSEACLERKYISISELYS